MTATEPDQLADRIARLRGRVSHVVCLAAAIDAATAADRVQ